MKKKKHVIVFALELEMTDEEHEDFVQYEDDVREMLKRELNKQVDECEYISTTCIDRSHLLRKIYRRDEAIEKVKIIKVINDNSIPFNVRLVEKGDAYGLNNKLIHEENEPMVEFYDARFSEDGQFVSRYYLSTILSHNGGLTLDGGIDDWVVSDENIKDVKYFFGNVR